MEKLKGILDFCKYKTRIYCFGAGRFGRELSVYLKERNILLTAFLTSEDVKDGREILGVPLMNIKKTRIRRSDGVILAISKRFATEMKEILEELGISDFYYVDENYLYDIENHACFDFIFQNNQYINVLFYHRIIESSRDDWNICVSIKNFEAHMKWIKENYRIVRFGDDWSNISEPSVVITFDDGYADNYWNALPILKKYNIPATFFISSACTHEEDVFWWDKLSEIAEKDKNIDLKYEHTKLKTMKYDKRKLYLNAMYGDRVNSYLFNRGLNEDELKRLADDPLVEIGAHTVTHESLKLLGESQQKDEILTSKAELEALLERKIDLFSYPYGDYNEFTVRILKESGFLKAATVSGGLAGTGNPFLIPRNAVRNWDIIKFSRMMKMFFCIYADVK